MSRLDRANWHQADAFYLEGGNTFYLLRAIRRTGFAKNIRLALKRGGLYVGSSAGSYVACPSIIASTWKTDPKPRYGLKRFKGLSLVPFIIKVHYQPSMKTDILKGLRRTKFPLRILKDGQAFLVEGKKVRLVGQLDEARVR